MLRNTEIPLHGSNKMVKLSGLPNLSQWEFLLRRSEGQRKRSNAVGRNVPKNTENEENWQISGGK